MRDLWQEIMISIRTNKMRTFLTGFSIAWGIFMLIVLLAAGNGLKNGMQSNFRYMSTNSISIYEGYTTMPYQGFQKNRHILFTQADVDFFEQHLPNMEHYSPIYNKWDSGITYGKKYTSGVMTGVRPEYINIRSIELIEGRFINQTDMIEKRKVVVVHKKRIEHLMSGMPALGAYVFIDKVPFQVVGIYDESGGDRNPSFYIPFSTSQAIFNPSGYITDISYSITGIETEEQEKAYVDQVRRLVANRMMFHPDDRNAVYIANRSADYRQTQQVFGAISLFIWIIGIGTLIAGIVGISNIMLITVKERTREFGIRKALGATPNSILGLVILESITITTMFGYMGLVVGIALTEGISVLLGDGGGNGDGMTMFLNPTVELGVVFAATGVLIAAGVIAGYIPARKAVKIKPIEAMQAK